MGGVQSGEAVGVELAELQQLRSSIAALGWNQRAALMLSALGPTASVQLPASEPKTMLEQQSETEQHEQKQHGTPLPSADEAADSEPAGAAGEASARSVVTTPALLTAEGISAPVASAAAGGSEAEHQPASAAAARDSSSAVTASQPAAAQQEQTQQAARERPPHEQPHSMRLWQRAAAAEAAAAELAERTERELSAVAETDGQTSAVSGPPLVQDASASQGAGHRPVDDCGRQTSGEAATATAGDTATAEVQGCQTSCIHVKQKS